MIDAILFRIQRWRMKRWIARECRKDTRAFGADWTYQQCVDDDNAWCAAMYAQRGKSWGTWTSD